MPIFIKLTFYMSLIRSLNLFRFHEERCSLHSSMYAIFYPGFIDSTYWAVEYTRAAPRKMDMTVLPTLNKFFILHNQCNHQVVRGERAPSYYLKTGSGKPRIVKMRLYGNEYLQHWRVKGVETTVMNLKSETFVARFHNSHRRYILTPWARGLLSSLLNTHTKT